MVYLLTGVKLSTSPYYIANSSVYFSRWIGTLLIKQSDVLFLSME
jgi:hypothetical protein